MRRIPGLMLAVVMVVSCLSSTSHGDDISVKLRSLSKNVEDRTYTFKDETWKPTETAIIVCDVWDYHHCLNAVRRMEEFVPRMNEVLNFARQQGATIIHSPSDCMPAYEKHPARVRAEKTPVAHPQPLDIGSWCMRIPAEEQGVYPIDQSDGGEDDDPSEHKTWAAKLAGLGRNPGLPWKAQSAMIEIDGQKDYISDKGDEVWNILQARGIKHVILVGVHTNMCVLGRPFGLRQIARTGRQVVLMRDMTDCMYNPKRWPYVDHYAGNDLVISHLERFVCPTITSDQLLGGKPFHFKNDPRPVSDQAPELPKRPTTSEAFQQDWHLISLPGTWAKATHDVVQEYAGPAWYRCAVRIPEDWRTGATVVLETNTKKLPVKAWLDGQPLSGQGDQFELPSKLAGDDPHILVLRMEHAASESAFPSTPRIVAGTRRFVLAGMWQFRLGDDESWANIPLPAKFGLSPNIIYQPEDNSRKAAEPAKPKAEVKALILPGESFLVADRPAFIFYPEEKLRSKPQPWVFYAPTLPPYPDSHEKWMHEQFLAAGVAVAGIDVGESYGSPKSQELFSALHKELTEQRGFAPKPCLLGRSRGGLWVTSWACSHPDKVAGIAGIYPVFDFRTYPGLANAAPAYGLTPAELTEKIETYNPISRVAAIARKRVPVCIIHGDDDKVVPLKENSEELRKRYDAEGAGDAVQLIVAKGQGHNYWEGFFRCQELVDFTIARAKAGATSK